MRRVKASITALLQAEHERWALWLPVGFGTGIAGYFSLASEPGLWIGSLLVVVGSAVLAIAVRYRAPQRITIPIISLVLICAGFASAQWRTAAVDAPMLEKRIGPTGIAARVVRVEATAKSLRVVLERLRISGISPARTPEKIRIHLRGEQPELWPGDWVRVRAVLTPPPPPSAPGAFDFQRQSFFNRIGATGFAVGTAERFAAAADERYLAPATLLARLRHAITQRIRDGLPGHLGSIAAALMTGERRAIPDSITNAMRDAGLAHLLAISGLHLGLVAGILFVGLRAVMSLVPPLALRFPVKKWAAAVAIAGAFQYGLIAGATVPTQRAFVAVGLILLAVLLDRRGLSLRSVAWAALIILVLQPESLLGASFQMSFAAATALVAGYEVLREYRPAREPATGPLNAIFRHVGLYIAGIGLTTLIAGLATAPFAAYHFGRVADYGLLANLVAVPITALWVMPWAVVAFLAMPFGLEQLALSVMSWGIAAVVGTAQTVAAWPGAVTLLPAMPLWGLIAAAIGGTWLCLWRRGWRLAGLVGVALAFVSTTTVTTPHLLVDGDGRLVAARTADGRMAVDTPGRAAFTRDMWLRRAGLTVADGKWPSAALNDARNRDEEVNGIIGEDSMMPHFTCDITGCLYRIAGRTVAIAYDEAALVDDCWHAEIVLSLVPVRRRCPTPVAVIDRFDLWRNGAHAITLSPENILVESVNGVRGDRPWVVGRRLD